MNLYTTNITINRCVVCEYPFSDKHHIYPQALGGSPLPTVSLCPNHHRFANLVQAMVIQCMTNEQIEAFARDYFDPLFTDRMLPWLIEEQRHLQVGVSALREYAEALEHYVDMLEHAVYSGGEVTQQRPTPPDELDIIRHALGLDLSAEPKAAPTLDSQIGATIPRPDPDLLAASMRAIIAGVHPDRVEPALSVLRAVLAGLKLVTP